MKNKASAWDKKRVYALTHTYDMDTEKKIYFRCDFTKQDLIKLIQIWQIKLCDKNECCDISTSEWFEVFKCFGFEEVDNLNGIKSIMIVNMYNIWEWIDIKSLDREDKDFQNEKAEELLEKYYQEWKLEVL